MLSDFIAPFLIQFQGAVISSRLDARWTVKKTPVCLLGRLGLRPLIAEQICLAELPHGQPLNESGVDRVAGALTRYVAQRLT